MTESVQEGLFTRLMSLLSDRVLEVAALCAIGLLCSVAWTAWRKVAIKRREMPTWERYEAIRREAFWAATIPTAVLMLGFAGLELRPLLASLIVLAPLMGLLSPWAYELVVDRLWPRLTRRRRRRAW